MSRGPSFPHLIFFSCKERQIITLSLSKRSARAYAYKISMLPVSLKIMNDFARVKRVRVSKKFSQMMEIDTERKREQLT